MKKLFCLFLSLLLIFTACSSNKNEAPKSAEEYMTQAFIDPITDWKKYDDIINEINNTADFSRRAELMHQAEDILMSTACILPLYYNTDNYLQKNYLYNVYSNPFGHKYFNQALLSNNTSVLTVNLQNEPYTLDPSFDSSMHGATIAVNSFAGLYTYNDKGKTLPDLATGYTAASPAPDGSVTYTVTLISDAKWSDGSVLNANDFVYSWKRTANSDADYSEHFSLFKGYPNNLQVIAVNDTTLEFTLIKPCAYIESLLASPTFFPVKQSEVERYSDDQIWCERPGFVSNGPFKCVSWDHGKSMTYEKNPYYHNKHNVNIEKIKFVFAQEDLGTYNDFKYNKIDFVDSLHPDAISSHTDKSEMRSVQLFSTTYISFNTQSDVFKNRTAEEATSIRLAINALIDRYYLGKNVANKNQTAANSLIPMGISDGNGNSFKPDLTANAYFNEHFISDKRFDALEAATNYLKAGGISIDGSGRVAVTTPVYLKYIMVNNNTNHLIAQALKSDLEILGITLDIVAMDWTEYLNERKAGNYDLTHGGFIATYDDPSAFLNEFTTDSSSNHCRFGNTSKN